MKLIHLSDLHLGKRVNAFSMLEDQEFILTKIIHVIDKEQPDAVLIAGDIYDKSIPPVEAVRLLDDFLNRLAKRKRQVFMISGNHDSPDRLAFGNRLIDTTGIHISPVYDGAAAPLTLEDTFGETRIYMLPFVKPADVRSVYPDAEIASYTDALRLAIEKMNIDTTVRNVLVTHQFITGGQRSESEDVSVGGADNVDVSVFDGFDYVALGHLHGPQNIGSERVRYAGSPLKYSFSEAKHEKSVTVVELKAKGDLVVREVPLIPKHDMVEIRGLYEELTNRQFYENTSLRDDYIHVTLTDEDDVPDAAAKLRVIYRHLMKLEYDNRRTRHQSEWHEAQEAGKTPLEMFQDFFEQQNGFPMTEEQTAFTRKLIEDIQEVNACDR